MYFTESEKNAIFALTAAMAAADGRLAENEKNFGACLALKLNHRPAQMDVERAINVVKVMTGEEKRLVCGLCGAMMVIDENIAEKEVLMWNLLTAACDFPAMSIGEAAQIAKNFLQN